MPTPLRTSAASWGKSVRVKFVNRVCLGRPSRFGYDVKVGAHIIGWVERTETGRWLAYEKHGFSFFFNNRADAGAWIKSVWEENK